MLALQSIWFLLPAGFANMAPVFAARFFPSLGRPIHTRLFGSHKTYRGFISGIAAATAIYALQELAFARSSWVRSELCVFDYERARAAFGAVMGLGALLGDLAKSFAKRRIGKKPGEPWVPFDQIDWVLGTLCASSFVVRPGPRFSLLTIGVALLLSVAAKWIGYLIRLNRTPI